MKSINEAALARLAASPMTGEGGAQLFKLLGQAAELAPSGANVSMSLDFHKPGDPVQPGDLFPVITLSLAASSELSPVDGTDLPTDR